MTVGEAKKIIRKYEKLVTEAKEIVQEYDKQVTEARAILSKHYIKVFRRMP